MVSYPLIKEGQLSHKNAIASPVEPMNLLSKGSDELLPKYRFTKWKNGLVPPCSILLVVIQVLEPVACEVAWAYYVIKGGLFMNLAHYLLFGVT